MTSPPPPFPSPIPPPPQGAAAPPRRPGTSRRAWTTRAEVRAAATLAVAMLAAGVLAGLVWWGWSPPRGIALALGRDTLLPDETEAFVAADGRFAVLTGGLGLVAGLVAWWLPPWRRARGVVVPLGLALGGLGGALLTALVGRLAGGGVTGAATRQIVTPVLEVRALGLLLLEALVALLVYGMSVTMSARDDLGVDEPREPGREATDPADVPERAAPVFPPPPDDRRGLDGA